MECFIAVVEAGSFVAAGDALRVSKAAVSRSVIALEARLGARLLQRTTRRLSLTEAGEAYYARCKQILADLDEADGAVGQVTGQPVGRLRINVPVSFGILHLAPLWGRFMQLYPEVALDVTLSDRFVDVVEEGYDAVVRIGRLDDSTLVSRQLARTRMVLCATPEYLTRHGTPQALEDLMQHRIISYAYASSGDVWRFHRGDEVRELQLRASFRTNNGDTCTAVALAHQGVVCQPDFLIYRELREGRLVEVLPDYPLGEVGIHVLYPSRKHLLVKVRAWVEFLSEAFAEPVWQQAKPEP